MPQSLELEEIPVFGVASACRSVLVRTRVEWPVRLPVSAQHRVHRRLCRPTKQVSHRVIEPLSANVRGHQSGHTSEPRSGDECLHTEHLNHISALTISSAAICRKPLQRQAEPRSLSPQTDQGKIMGIHRKNNRSHAKRFVTTAAGAGALALACTIVDYERSQCTRLVAGCRVREFPETGNNQHRQRLLRRTSIHAVDVGCIQTGKRTGPRRLGVDGRSSRRCGSNPLSSGHRRVAGMWASTSAGAAPPLIRPPRLHHRKIQRATR